MKKFLVISLMLFALHASAQRNYPLNGTPSITSIHTGNEASEGDLYYDTTTGDLYIGLNDGTLYLMEQDSQSISLAGNILSITRGNSVDLAPFTNTDNQDLSLAGNTLSLTNDATPVDLAPYLDNTDNQDLSLAGNTLSLTNDGTTVDLSPYLDNTDNQDLSLAGNTLSLTNDGTTVDLSPYLDNTDNQDLSLSGNTLSLTNDGTSVDLTPYVNTDNQAPNLFAINASNVLELSLQRDAVAPVSVDLTPYVNTDNQDLSLAGNTLSLTNDGTPVDLTPYVNTDNQDLSLAGNTLSLTNDGTTVDLSPYLDNTDNQDLSLAGNTLSLTNDGTPVDLTPYVNTDNQDLSLAGNTLSLTNDGTTVDLSPYLDNTDNQDLSLAGNTLSLTNDGTTVDLSPYLDNTDDQTLTYTNTDPDDNINTLQIEGSAAFNIDDNHLGTDNQTLDADRTVDMNGNGLTFDGTQDVIIEADGDVGIGTSTPGARLDVDNGSVKFSDYGVGTYLDTLTGTHPHSAFHLGVDAFGNVVEVNTVKSAKIFYPPSIVIDVGSVSSNLSTPGDEDIDLYDEYVARFGSPLLSSPSGPSEIPTYDRDELYYYVTDLDTTVFDNYSIDDGGNFSYDVKSVPTGNCTWINVVFVVK